MGLMAYWNGMLWTVSREAIMYLDGLSTTYKMTEASNNDKTGKSPTENIGMELEEYSFSTEYKVETGTPDVWAIVELWKSMIGKAAPLIIGSRQIGPPKLQLKQVSVGDVKISALGTVRSAKLSFSFKEFAEKKTGIKTKKNSAGDETASQITASSTDKKAKKTKTIK